MPGCIAAGPECPPRLRRQIKTTSSQPSGCHAHKVSFVSNLDGTFCSDLSARRTAADSRSVSARRRHRRRSDHLRFTSVSHKPQRDSPVHSSKFFLFFPSFSPEMVCLGLHVKQGNEGEEAGSRQDCEKFCFSTTQSSTECACVCYLLFCFFSIWTWESISESPGTIIVLSCLSNKSRGPWIL